jgi:hypothetical protein
MDGSRVGKKKLDVVREKKFMNLSEAGKPKKKNT